MFLSYLVEILHETEHYTEKEVVDEIGSMLIAVSIAKLFRKSASNSVNKGSHSTALSMSSALMLIGMYPEIQVINNKAT